MKQEIGLPGESFDQFIKRTSPNPRSEINELNSIIYEMATRAVKRKKWNPHFKLEKYDKNMWRFSIDNGTIHCYYHKYLLGAVIKSIF